jgi:glycosyltransferase involved in cell wall biosynthesis
VRNAASRLEKTLASLEAQFALKKGHCRLEHILLDGASTDNTIAVASRYPNTQCFSEPDQGMYDALAKGFRRGTGDIVGYINAGDTLFPWAFDVLLEVFENPDVRWATGYSTLMNERNQVTASWKPCRYRREFVENGFYADPGYPCGIQQESTFWKSDLGDLVDLDRLAKFCLAGDYFLWAEFAKYTELHSIMSPLGAFLIHDGQLSENMSAYRAEAESVTRSPRFRECFTRWWETRCPPSLRGLLWNFTLRRSPAKIFEYNHSAKCWTSR